MVSGDFALFEHGIDAFKNNTDRPEPIASMGWRTVVSGGV